MVLLGKTNLVTRSFSVDVHGQQQLAGGGN